MSKKKFAETGTYDWAMGSQGEIDTGYSYKPKLSCYHSHPQLKLGGGTVIGGSCSDPVTTKADIYIGFDWGMKMLPYKPWHDDIGPLQVPYEIHDRGVPKDPADFKLFIKWLAHQLSLGKTIHLGCIGGHGRTGMVISALWAYIKDDPDAIEHVRVAYCHRAVESDKQVKFLHDHFGCNVVPSYDSLRPPPPKEEKKVPKATGGKEFKPATSFQDWALSGERARAEQRTLAFPPAGPTWSPHKDSNLSVWDKII